jgi:hypothetical protein
MDNTKGFEEYELPWGDIEAMKTFAQSVGRDENQVVPVYKVQRRRGLSHWEAHELISFVFGPGNVDGEVTIEDCIEGYWQARGFGESHGGAMRLLNNLTVDDLQVLFDNWARYVELNYRGLTDRQAQQCIVTLAQYVELAMEEKVDLYWNLRQEETSHVEALSVMFDARMCWGNLKLGLSRFFAARRRGFSVRDAAAMMRIAARYRDMSLDDLIEFYWRLRGLGTRGSDALDIMSFTDITNPRFFELWPYYVEQRTEGLPLFEAVELVFYVPTYVDAPMETIIEFYWRLREVLDLHYYVMQWMTTEHVSDPDIFNRWPFNR